LAATAVVFLFYWYFGRQLGRRAGLIAGLLVPVGFMWLDKASAAEIDTLQVAWVTAAILFFLRALEEEDRETGRQGDKEPGVVAFRGRLGAEGVEEIRPVEAVSLSPCLPVSVSAFRWWFAAMLCVAGGVLTKWTAPAFFYATAITLLWRRGQLRLLLGRRHL